MKQVVSSKATISIIEVKHVPNMEGTNFFCGDINILSETVPAMIRNKSV